jgi:hypothetical protein
MKEKISEYLDGRVDKEEMENYLREHPEDRVYYEQLLAMKETLSQMKLNAPDVSFVVLSKTKKQRFVKKLAFLSSVVAVVFVSVVLVKVYVFKPEMKVNIAQSPPNTGLRSFGVMNSIPSIDITINKDSENDLLNILKSNGTIVSTENAQPQAEQTTPTKDIKYRLNPKNLSEIDKSVKAITGASITIPTLDTASNEIDVEIYLTEK